MHTGGAADGGDVHARTHGPADADDGQALAERHAADNEAVEAVPAPASSSAAAAAAAQPTAGGGARGVCARAEERRAPRGARLQAPNGVPARELVRAR